MHIELTDSADWPDNVRVGSKASAIVFTQGTGNPVAALAGLLQTATSYMSYLY